MPYLLLVLALAGVGALAGWWTVAAVQWLDDRIGHGWTTALIAVAVVGVIAGIGVAS